MKKDSALNMVKDNRKIVLLFIGIAIFILALINVLNGNISKFDTSVYNMVISLKSDFVTNIFKIITEFGSMIALILIAVVCLIFIKNKKIGLSIVVNLISIAILNYLLKITIQRPRPPLEFRMVEENSFSFPSGHSMSGLAFYGLIIYFVFNNVKNKKFRNVICVGLSLLVFLIGLSRIYLGVHYASDVLAGFSFSIAYLIIYTQFILKLIGIKE